MRTQAPTNGRPLRRDGVLDLFPTIDRLAESYPPECLDIVHDEYFRRPYETVHRWLAQLSDEEHAQQLVNALDWVIGESLVVDDEDATRLRRPGCSPSSSSVEEDGTSPVPFLDSLLFEQDRRLTVDETLRLRAISETPIGVYDVLASEPQQGLWLREARQQGRRFFAFSASASRRVNAGDRIATRVLAGAPPLLSGALFNARDARSSTAADTEGLKKRILETGEPAWRVILDASLDGASDAQVNSSDEWQSPRDARLVRGV